MVSAIVVAAGKGERLAQKEEKPFVKLGNQPIIFYSLNLFEKIPEVSSVILVVSEGRLSEAAALLSSGKFKKVKEVVSGGSSRQESVIRGLSVLELSAEVVLIHDGARPLVSTKKVKELIAAGREIAVIPALPVSDTLKEVEKGYVLRTPERKIFYAAQTPQAFPREVILTAYQMARRSGFIATDDASVVEAAGFPVKIIEGERTNIKITYPEDLILAESILKIAEDHGLSD